jgi:hypothetical protein
MSSPLSSDTDTFRFLDLPVELRVMIYEHIPNKVIRYEYKDVNNTKKACLALEVVQVQTEILSTCREVYMEASKIMKKKQALVACVPVRIVIIRSNVRNFEVLFYLHRRLQNADRYLSMSHRVAPDLTLPRNKLIALAFKRLAHGLPKVEFVLDFPDMSSLAGDAVEQIMAYRWSQVTICVPPDSFPKSRHGVDVGAGRSLTIIWDE